jgi:hypothetical protein
MVEEGRAVSACTARERKCGRQNGDVTEYYYTCGTGRTDTRTFYKYMIIKCDRYFSPCVQAHMGVSARAAPSRTPPPSTVVFPPSYAVGAAGGSVTIPVRRCRARSRRDGLYGDTGIFAAADGNGMSVAGLIGVAGVSMMLGRMSVGFLQAVGDAHDDDADERDDTAEKSESASESESELESPSSDATYAARSVRRLRRRRTRVRAARTIVARRAVRISTSASFSSTSAAAAARMGEADQTRRGFASPVKRARTRPGSTSRSNCRPPSAVAQRDQSTPARRVATWIGRGGAQPEVNVRVRRPAPRAGSVMHHEGAKCGVRVVVSAYWSATSWEGGRMEESGRVRNVMACARAALKESGLRMEVVATFDIFGGGGR